MASTDKDGIGYFNIDCEQEDNLEFIIAKHKAAGYGTVVQLWRKIFRFKGYYTDFKEKNQYLFIADIGITMEFLWEVLNTCFEENIFNKEIYDKYQVLTSSGVQKRWLKIVTLAKRKNIKIDQKFDLISDNQELIKKTPEKTAETPESEPQSKVKESKEKESNGSYTRDAVFENEILKFFGFTEMPHHHQQAKLLFEFCCAQHTKDQLNYFKHQFSFYKKYIDLIGKKYKKSFYKFLGKQSDQFEDGEWSSENWELKVAEETGHSPPKNGKSFPNDYDKKYAQSLAGDELESYLQHVRKNGWRFEKYDDRGNALWIKQN